jgi:hypothetical protein
MKKIFYLLLLIPVLTIAQEIKVKVDKTVTKEDSYSDIVNASSAYQKAQAAKAAAMSKPSSEIKVPLKIDLYNYEAIAIVSTNGDWRTHYTSTAESFGNSPLTIINPFKYNKKKFKKNSRFLRDIKNPKWLYVYYTKSIQGVDDVRTLVVRNHQNRILYHVVNTNITFDETISPFVNF